MMTNNDVKKICNTRT